MLAKGHRVTLVLLAGTFAEKFDDCSGLSLRAINHRGSDLNPATYRTLATNICETRPDCLFVPLKRDWWIASLCAHWLRVPRTVLYLGIQRRLKANLKYRLIFQRFRSQLLVNSNALKQDVTKALPWLNEANTHLIYNGFPLPDINNRTETVKAQLGIPENSMIIGCAGRLSRQKGFDQLPAILKQLPDHVHVFVAGQGDQETTLRDLFEAEGLSDRIHLLGRQTDMKAFYQSLGVFLLTSRNEGMANVLNEAMSFGLPVVSTDAPGSSELLGFDNKLPLQWPETTSYLVGPYGLLTRKEAPEALAEAIMAIMEGKHPFPAEQQRQKIKLDHSLEGMMIRTERLFFTPEQSKNHQQNRGLEQNHES